MPEVSVIIPNFNHALFLKQRIDSVLYQSYQDFELIILDDCSTDNSREIIELYRNNPKVAQIVYNDINSGSTFKQWNKGVSLARGKYVWIAESDDSSHTLFLDTAIKQLQNKDTGLFYSKSLNINQEGEEMNLTNWYSFFEGEEEKWNNDYFNIGQDEFVNYCSKRNLFINTSAIVFIKQIYQNIGGADEQYKYIGDWLLWSKFLLKTNVYYCSKPYNHFRHHENTTRWGNSSKKNKRKILETYLVLLEFKKLIGCHPHYKTLNYVFDMWHDLKSSPVRFLKNFSIRNYLLAVRLDKKFNLKILQLFSKKLKSRLLGLFN